MDSLEIGLKKAESLEKGLREIVQEELDMIRGMDRGVQVELFNGFAVYGLGDSDFVLATVHNGSYVPDGVELRQTSDERAKEEDLFTGELYLPIFLEKGGRWITSHLSRYFVDLNRSLGESILCYGFDSDDSNLVVENLDAEKRALEFYNQFYSVAEGIVPGRFLFSGHSMNPQEDMGNFCLIYKFDEEGETLKRLLGGQSFKDILINDPFNYGLGHFRVYFDVLTTGSVEFETNKDLYLDSNLKKLPGFDSVSQRISKAVIGYLS